mmetsp:Transcript_38754/g.89302  ORF Transcript_38754/g.89302 Transcript_38754/m.89302 type:complete len:662 (+) Transcript_38754:70-2055(+)|eukprot:CAMPEP_0182563822 /NCGR_PEP_ID=MMETSP1324-20130603/5874_1 /TAXON_ID=236786 /ORGANISM="Florenciella sp., Strain RCC1587" /LENGTH=661 /DNA_ID=CAMNT_0024777127 /DNA_START=66 /DNA_END=2051 /DNA_ORIENTATION=-
MAMKLVTAAAMAGVAFGMTATPQRSEAAALASKKSAEAQTQPNIVTVMIDDLGWNDVGWHDEKFATPTMSSLAETGVVLERFYTAPTCTPSRSQFMTGRYNIRNGMQDSVLHSTEPRGVPLNEEFLSTKLQTSGYRTVAIGKWHMGMHQSSYLPLSRGFDRHYGIYTGGGSHTGHFSVSQSFTVRHQADAQIWQGYNIWEDGVPSEDNYGKTHSTHLYSGKAAEFVDLFETEDDDTPFFMYLAYQAVHDPIEVGDEKYVSETTCSSITSPPGNKDDSGIDWDNRQILCGMVAEIDDGVKNLVLKLKELDEWDNTFMLVFSDNGGVGVHGSKNLPLRGEKADYWEGGVRVPAFVTGGFTEGALATAGVSPYSNTDMVHITDLHTTILNVAGYKPESTAEAKPLDGVSHLSQWIAGGSSVDGVEAARSEMLVNINSALFGGSGAIHVGDYKMIVNPEPSESRIYAKTRKALVAKQGILDQEDFQQILTYVHAEVLGTATKYIFNIAKNEFETEDDDCTDAEACSNLYDNEDFADVREMMEEKWGQWKLEAAPSTFMWADDGPLADPALFGGMWDSWRDGDNTPKAQYFGMSVLDADKFEGMTAMLHHSTDLAVSMGSAMALTGGSGSFGMMAVALTVFGAAIGMVSYRAGKRSGGSSTYESLA